MAAPYQDCAILFGDSITSQQYVCDNMQSRFCDAYRRTLDILNRGFGGYNTRWARQLFSIIFAAKGTPNVPAVRLVTIWFGANDAALPGSKQHVPLDEYTSHIRFFLEQLTSPHSELAVAHTKGLNIVLVTPPPLLVSLMGDGPFSLERTNENTKLYADAVLSLAAEYKAKETEGGNWRIGIVDMWTKTLEVAAAATGNADDGLPEYLSDGLHLTSAGYSIFWDEYRKLVKGEFKGRGLDWEDLEDLPLRIPSWDAVDPADPRIVEGMNLPPMRRA